MAFPVALQEDMYGGGPQNDLLRTWLSMTITREAAESSLRGSPAGSFIVRRSTSAPGSYAITVNESSRIHSYQVTDLGLGQVGVGHGHAFASLEHLLEFFYEEPFPSRGEGHVPLKYMHDMQGTGSFAPPPLPPSHSRPAAPPPSHHSQFPVAGMSGGPGYEEMALRPDATRMQSVYVEDMEPLQMPGFAPPPLPSRPGQGPPLPSRNDGPPLPSRPGQGPPLPSRNDGPPLPARPGQGPPLPGRPPMRPPAPYTQDSVYGDVQ